MSREDEIRARLADRVRVVETCARHVRVEPGEGQTVGAVAAWTIHAGDDIAYLLGRVERLEESLDKWLNVGFGFEGQTNDLEAELAAERERRAWVVATIRTTADEVAARNAARQNVSKAAGEMVESTLRACADLIERGTP